MPNWHAPIPERLVTRNLSKIPIRLPTLVQRRCRPAVARQSSVSGCRRFRRHSHDTGRPPGVKFRGGKIGKRLFRPPRVTGGAGREERIWRFWLGSLGRSPYNLVVTDRTSLYNRIMVGRSSGVKDDSPSFPKNPHPWPPRTC